MPKNVSVSTLLVVAVVGLALMGFVGFQDGATGMQMGAPGVSYPSVPDNVAYTIHAGTASQATQVQMMVTDSLKLQLLIHCKGATDSEIVALCQKYSVSTS